MQIYWHINERRQTNKDRWIERYRKRDRLNRDYEWRILSQVTTKDLIDQLIPFLSFKIYSHTANIFKLSVFQIDIVTLFVCT